jgi:hypothetical protein
MKRLTRSKLERIMLSLRNSFRIRRTKLAGKKQICQTWKMEAKSFFKILL